jgi:outer membrane murein-binding lipoprotein Lpp
MSENQLPIEDRETEIDATPSRAAIWLRSLLRWGTVILIVFALGAIATLYIRVRPLISQVEELQAQTDQLSAELSDAQSELDRLHPLEVDFEDAQLRLDLLRILLDVTSARLALAEEDSLTARFSLTGTENALRSLRGKLTGNQASDLEAMQSRLSLVMDELEQDQFAAKSDLEVIANWVVSLERELFQD